MLRNPKHFHRAAGWDTGIRVDTGPITEQERNERIKKIFGSNENFERYRLSTLLGTRGRELGDQTRLFYYNTAGTKRSSGGAKLHQRMVELEIAHHYVFEANRRHRWDSGWVPKAVEFLVEERFEKPTVDAQ